MEKQAEQLLHVASSLLLYQPVLRGKPATAFLTLLAALAGGPPTRVLESFGELFRALVADGHASWHDYVLEQVGRSFNPSLDHLPIVAISIRCYA